jgi:hypothetical protein
MLGIVKNIAEKDGCKNTGECGLHYFYNFILMN